MRQMKIAQSITNRDAGSFDKYLTDISRIDLLTVEEEIVLTRKIKKGDKAAKEKLIKANLRFVISVAKRYQSKDLRLGDLISEGNLGLIKAAERFDETKGFKFISFAVWWIRQSIMQAIQDQRRMVRLPGNQTLGIMKINKATEKLEQELERLPTYEELSEATELSVEKIVDYLLSAPMTYSLDMHANDDSEFCLMDTITNENSPESDAILIGESFKTDLNRMLMVLPEREQKILQLFYGLNNETPLTLDDMIPVFDLSKERIRQLKDKALKTLRTHFKRTPISNYN